MAIFSAGVIVRGLLLFYSGIMVSLAFWAYLIFGFLLFICVQLFSDITADSGL
jgi:hypothetical protein